MFKTSVSHPLSSIASPPFSDAPGTTVGKGFTGVMKKWGFKGQGASHGNSKAHRKAGGIGACQDPGKVWPGKKMAGRSGAVRRTVLSLRVAGVDADRGLVYLAGAVPGGAGSPVRVSDAVLARHGGRQPVARPFPTQL
jgi:large subunit ribosomal protein L3